MSRRSIYSKVNKTNQNRPSYADGMGDRIILIFGCLNPTCSNLIQIPEDEVTDNFDIVCDKCHFHHKHGAYQYFYSYNIDVATNTNNVSSENTYETIDSGDFRVSHDEYIAKAAKFKYCIVCYTLQPLENFSIHHSRKSGRQGECKTCKTKYNSIKNQTRIADQFTESSQKRRLYTELSGTEKINRTVIFSKFNNQCFNCGRKFSKKSLLPHLDHTLPNKYLWPLTTDSATLLCSKCNLDKADRWPSEFYTDAQLKSLSRLTGFDYSTLHGPAFYNPDSITKLHSPKTVNNMLTEYANYMHEMIHLRNRILTDTQFDFFSVSNSISKKWIDDANKEL